MFKPKFPLYECVVMRGYTYKVVARRWFFGWSYQIMDQVMGRKKWVRRGLSMWA